MSEEKSFLAAEAQAKWRVLFWDGYIGSKRAIRDVRDLICGGYNSVGFVLGGL
ncbi:hypothetical protein BH23PAT2_BH23PAT2_03340 [soil metagenome]